MTPAVSIGVYYNKITKKITHVKVPDWEEELDVLANIQPGEKLLRVPMEKYGRITKETLHHFISTIEDILYDS